MGFNYNRIKTNRGEHGSYWTSYSDLFLMLSTVFLLLYVVSNLRSGAMGVQKTAEYQHLAKEAEDLKEQIRVYNALRDEQIAQSSEDEQQTYANLMDKLKLLQDQARSEKDDLRRKATENEKKELALNRYQQIIRNIINVNVLAKGQIKRRDQVIQNKEGVIQKQDSQIQQLNVEVSSQEKTIADNNARIATAKQELARKIAKLKATQQKANSSRQSLQRAISELRAKSANEISELESRNRKASNELDSAQNRLARVNASLEQTEEKLSQVKTQSGKEKASLMARLEKTKADYEGQMKALKEQSEQKSEAEKAAFEADLNKQRLTASAREQKEAEFRKHAEGETKRLQAALGELDAKSKESQRRLAEAEEGEGRALAELEGLKKENARADGEAKRLAGALGDAEAKSKEAQHRLDEAMQGRGSALAELDGLKKENARAAGEAKRLAGALGDAEARSKEAQRHLNEAMQGQGRALAAVEGLKKEKAAMSEDLKRARDLADARKRLAAAIVSNFKKAGIKAEIDGRTGDVTLAFPDDYFDTGQSSLKPGMESRLRTFIPAYTESLFKDPKTAEKIANVEIIGFASSTFKGKYVNPLSLKPGDREAIDYNLKLSFSRANAIFKYIFDKDSLTYSHQEALLPLVKVVGRGYLPESLQGHEIPEGLSEKKFCEKFNCKKAQKVVVKFNLKD